MKLPKTLSKFENDERLLLVLSKVNLIKNENSYSHLCRLLLDNTLSVDDVAYYYTTYWSMNKSQRSGASKENCILRYGPNNGEIEYANHCKRSREALNIAQESFLYCQTTGKQLTARSVEWWVRRYGISEEEAKCRIYTAASAGGKKADITRKSNPRWRDSCTASIDYYLAKGYSTEEAKALLRNRQQTFTRLGCIEKHGLAAGLSIFNARQQKWQDTMNNKSDEEKAEINLKRVFNGRGYSKESQDFIRKLRQDMMFRGYTISNEYFHELNNEYFIRTGSSIFLYDYMFIINDIKFILEYHGVAWHPKSFDYSWVSPVGTSYEFMRGHDELKKTTAVTNGFIYFEIFSDYTTEDYMHLIEEIINEIEDIS
jgi:hypothetical protein